MNLKSDIPTTNREHADRQRVTTRVALILAGFVLLAAGGWVYISARPGTLVYLLCHDALASSATVSLSDFVRYSLPNTLWSLSSILVLHALLADEAVHRRLLWVSIVPLSGIISELMQGAGLLGGTFDPADLICYLVPLMIYNALCAEQPRPKLLRKCST